MTDGGTSLGLAEAPNARDLGGYRTRDGSVLRRGVALRAEAPTKLTGADLAVLARLGVRTVVDFRGEAEIAATGASTLPAELARFHLPVFTPEHDIYVTLAPLFTTDDHDLQHRLLGDGGAERIMEKLYRWFVGDPAARAPFSRTLQLLADPEARPVLFHCTAGKDRTGWMAAIILTALDVPEETVLADYLLTNERQAPLLDLFRGSDSRIDPELIAPLLDVRERYLRSAFDQVKRDFGDFPTFFRDGLGGDLEALRAALL